MSNLRKVVAGQPIELQAEFVNRTIDLLQPTPSAGRQPGKGQSVNGRPYLYNITGSASVGGMYKGVYVPNLDLSLDGAVAVTIENAYNALNSFVDCYIFNWLELGKLTHSLPGGIPGVGILAGTVEVSGTVFPLIHIGGPNELPPSGLKYQVLMKLDDNQTVGWSYPRFAE